MLHPALPSQTRGAEVVAKVLDELGATDAQRAEVTEALVGRAERSSSPTAADAMRRAVLETTPNGIITIDEHGTIHAFNPAAERIFGYSAGELLGQNIRRLMPSPDRERHDRYIRRFLDTGEPRIIGSGREVRGLRRNGAVFPMELIVAEICVDRHRRFIGIIRDVSERKAVEQALEEERNFVTAILNTAAVLVMVMDRDGRIIRFNRQCEATTGYREREVKGRRFWDHLIPEEESDLAREAYDQLVREKRPNNLDNHLLTAFGVRRLISWSNTVLVNAAGGVDFVVGTGIDITERQRAKEALVSISEDMRRQVGQELHDALGQQLTGISLLSKTLERRLQEAGRSEVTFATEITDLARGAVAEVRRLAHGLYPVALERDGLHGALAELAEASAPHAPGTCRYAGTPSPFPIDKTTALHLYRIAQEAANNAVKYAEASEILIDFFATDKRIELMVQDNGVGFPSPHPGNQGMGLAIMRYRAQLIGAELDIDSFPSRGTTVLCRLRDHRALPECPDGSEAP